MKFVPKPWQTFLILSMLFGETPEEREPTYSGFKIAPKLRAELVKAGLLRTEKRKKATHLILEDEAWDFAVRHLDAELPKTERASKLLQKVLKRLGAFMDAHDHSLAEFVAGAAPEGRGGPASAQQTSGLPGEEQIRAACLAITCGETRKRVRLKDLRAKVPIARDALDRALLAMQTAGRLVLYKMDNPAEISAEDERAALFVGDQPRHLVYLEA